MLKYLGVLFTVSFALIFSAVPTVLAESDCDFSYSNHARAAQLHAMGDLTAALQHYECALEQDPDNDILQMIISDLYDYDAGLTFVETSNTTCDPAISHHAEAAQLSAMGDYQGAISAFECALVSNPDNTSIMMMLANIYVKIEAYDQAYQHLSHAIAVDHGYAPLYSRRAYVNYMLGNYEAGLLDADDALRINPDLSSARDIREQILMASLAEQRDIGIISGVVRTPDATPAPSNVGKNSVPQLDDSGDLAIAQVTEAEPASPTPDTLRAAAHAFVGQGRYDLAIEQYEAILGFEPNNPDIHFRLGHAHYSLENFATALPYMEQALDLDPENLYVTYYLAMIHSQLNNRSDALTIMDDLYINGWYDGAFSLVMGHVYHNLGYPEVAGIQFYEWMTDRETMRLPAELSPLTNNTEIVMDYGVIYEIPFSAIAGQPVYVDVRSHILNPAPIDPLIVVMNDDGIPIAGDDDNGDLFDSSLNFMPPSTGDYTLIVSHAGGKHAGELDVELSGVTWSADAYRTLANQAFADADYPLAINMMNRAIIIDGGTADDYALLGRIYIRMGDLDSSAVMLSQGLELDPSRADIRCDLGSIYATWGDYANAFEQFDIILASNPTDSCAWSNRDALMQQHRTIGTVPSEVYESPVIRPSAPSPADELFEQGLQHLTDNRTFSAANAFLYAMIADPNHDRARCELAQIQLKWGNYLGAIQNVEHILSNNPTDVCASNTISAIKAKTSRIFIPMTVQEIQASEAVTERNTPSPADDLYKLGLEHLANNHEFSAGDAFIKAVSLDPDHLLARCELAKLDLAWGNYYHATQGYLYILSQDSSNPCGVDIRVETIDKRNAMYIPTSADDFVVRATRYYEIGEFDKAIESYETALKLNPHDIVARCYLGIAYSDSGDYQNAFYQWDVVLNQIPMDSCAASNRNALKKRMRTQSSDVAVSTGMSEGLTLGAEDFIRQGDGFVQAEQWVNAINAYLTALEFDPSRLDIRCRVGIIYTDLDDYDNAALQFNIVLSQDISNQCANNHQANLQDLVNASLTASTPSAFDFIRRGDAFIQSQQWTEAIDAYLLALDLDPSQMEIRCRVGILYTDLKQYEDALHQFNLVLSQDISNHCASNHSRNVKRILRDTSNNVSAYLTEQQDFSDVILVRDVYGYGHDNPIDALYEISLSMGVRTLMHEAQIRHSEGDVWIASALLDRYIDDNYATMCKGELRWLASEYREQGFTVMADMMHLKAIGDSSC